MLLHIFYGLHLYMKVSAVCFICCFRMSVNGNDNNGNGTVAKLVKRYENGSHNACAQMRASRSVQYITRVYVLCSRHINVPTFHYVFVFVHTFMCYTHTRKHTHTQLYLFGVPIHIYIHACTHARTHSHKSQISCDYHKYLDILTQNTRLIHFLRLLFSLFARIA